MSRKAVKTFVLELTISDEICLSGFGNYGKIKDSEQAISIQMLDCLINKQIYLTIPLYVRVWLQFYVLFYTVCSSWFYTILDKELIWGEPEGRERSFNWRNLFPSSPPHIRFTCRQFVPNYIYSFDSQSNRGLFIALPFARLFLMNKCAKWRTIKPNSK